MQNRTYEKGSVRYNSNRGIYWQKLFLLDENRGLLRRIVICVSEEALAMKLVKNLSQMNEITNDVKAWFIEQGKSFDHPDSKGEDLFYLYPKTPEMLKAAESMLDS